MMAAMADGRLWLEKLKIATRMPRGAATEWAGDDLAALLAAAVADPEFHEDLRQGLQGLRDKAPYELSDEPLFQALKEGHMETLLEGAAAAVLDRLEREG